MTEYDDIPGHPLCGIPDAALDAARSVTRDAAVWKDVDPDHAEAIADAVLAAAMPAIRGWCAERARVAVGEFFGVWCEDCGQAGHSRVHYDKT